MKLTQITKAKLVTYIPDTRGVEISPYGKGNLKIGQDVYTFSKNPGLPEDRGSCPGATEWCLAKCYAMRVVQEDGIVAYLWNRNFESAEVPPIPDDCFLLRIHIAGDFDRVDYIRQWVERINARPEVSVWAYTRSWRQPDLLPALEELRALPNVQLFASMDMSTSELPPVGWRRAWIEGDRRLIKLSGDHHFAEVNGNVGEAMRIGYLCPEETGRKRDCQDCNYCVLGHRGDVVFLKH